MALEITDQNINGVLETTDLVVIDFWAAWCGPCRMLGPIIDELSTENADVVIGKLDVTTNQETAQDYGVTSIPSIIFIKNGKEVERVRGVIPKSVLQNKINEFKN
jgi:thioredoxin 1